ncbi:MAG: hypothetical protein V1770_03255 [bacterium]
MIGQFFLMAFYLEQFLKKFNEKNFKLFSYIFLCVYCIISLSIFYYFLGLSALTLLAWLIITSFLAVVIGHKGAEAELDFTVLLKAKKKFEIIDSPSLIFIAAGISYLIANFFANPIKNGSPTPWINTSGLTFIIFFIITFLFLKNSFEKRNNIITVIFYFFLIISVISIKYVLSYGYDTMLHQASLQHIALQSRILPLTPFYIGQYVMELTINFFTGWSFIVIERWFLPVLSVAFLCLSGNYLLEKAGFKEMIAIAPIVALIMLPAQFTYTSPYAFSLLWGVVAVTFAHIFILSRRGCDYIGALLSALASTFIHPFVGLNVLVVVAGAWFYGKMDKRTKKIIVLSSVLLVESFIVLLSFGVYNWLRGSALVLADPFFYAHKFLSLFNDPIWYSRTAYSFWLSLIYLYEKLHFILIGAFILGMTMIYRKRLKADIFILIASLGAFMSAWLFISSLEVSGYGYGDQLNYSFRLLQSSKWLLWPIVLLAFAAFFKFMAGKRGIIKFLAIILFSSILTISWYLTYPRNDDISRINVNNIREVDYKAIDFIYGKEGGKDGYLVFANQLFGAGAIQKYGFEPYYNSTWGDLFYYSIPMGSEMNKRYEKIMSSEEFEPNNIYDAIRETGLRKAYFVVADYWPLAISAKRAIEKKANGYWNIENHKIDIYLFELK